MHLPCRSDDRSRICRSSLFAAGNAWHHGGQSGRLPTLIETCSTVDATYAGIVGTEVAHTIVVILRHILGTIEPHAGGRAVKIAIVLSRIITESSDQPVIAKPHVLPIVSERERPVKLRTTIAGVERIAA